MGLLARAGRFTFYREGDLKRPFRSGLLSNTKMGGPKWTSRYDGIVVDLRV